MRTIKIPVEVLRRAVEGPIEGRALRFSVEVDWPELRLTEGQILANAVWATDPHPTGPRPYPNHSIFDVELPYLPPK